jgi:hypothetical protein
MRPLTEIMEFDHVIEVHADGSVTDGPANIYAPDLYDGELQGEGWEFFTYGYTGQYGYDGPMMHNSEFIGGGLERDILAKPGLYVSLIGNYSCDEHEDECECDTAEGWAVAYHPTDEN